MARPETIKQISQDFAEGKLGKARDRLHSLVASHPEDLSFRKQLGEVYAQLQYPERAGCFWYLEEHKTPEMLAACEAFVQSKGGDPHRILASLKFGMDPELLPAGHAREVLLSLRAQAPNFRFSFARQPHEYGRPRTLRSQAGEAVLLVGCGLVAFGALMVFTFGVVALIMFARGYGFEKP